MKNKVFSIVILLAIALFGYNYIHDIQNEIHEKNLMIQVNKQNDSLSNVHIGLLQSNKDSLLNQIKLIETNIVIQKDTIYVNKLLSDTVIVNNDSTYTFSTTYNSNRFDLDIEARLSLNTLQGSFDFNYYEQPDSITVGVNYNKNSKLLIGYALVNNIEYKSHTNIYEKVYEGIYNEMISDYKPIKPKNWYNKIYLGVGLSYTWKGDILPCVNVSYGINISDLIKR